MFEKVVFLFLCRSVHQKHPSVVRYDFSFELSFWWKYLVRPSSRSTGLAYVFFITTRSLA